MDQQDTQLDKAREELAFWQDYAAWWQRETGTPPEPRVREALALAEQRLREAGGRGRKLRLL